MSFARATRGLRRPSLDARSEIPSRQAPEREGYLRYASAIRSDPDEIRFTSYVRRPTFDALRLTCLSEEQEEIQRQE